MCNKRLQYIYIWKYCILIIFKGFVSLFEEWLFKLLLVFGALKINIILIVCIRHQRNIGRHGELTKFTGIKIVF